MHGWALRLWSGSLLQPFLAPTFLAPRARYSVCYQSQTRLPTLCHEFNHDPRFVRPRSQLSPRLLPPCRITDLSFCLSAADSQRGCPPKGGQRNPHDRGRNQFTVCRDETNYSTVKSDSHYVIKDVVYQEDWFPSIPDLHTLPQRCVHLAEPASACQVTTLPLQLSREMGGTRDEKKEEPWL